MTDDEIVRIAIQFQITGRTVEFARALLSLADAPKWIPVSGERLPEYGKEVIVVTHGVTRTGWLRNPAYTGKGAAPWAAWPGVLRDVTNWQPLPEPPKG